MMSYVRRISDAGVIILVSVPEDTISDEAAIFWKNRLLHSGRVELDRRVLFVCAPLSEPTVTGTHIQDGGKPRPTATYKVPE
jgi:hypothetical protein